jgi:hypothetical protein
MHACMSPNTNTDPHAHMHVEAELQLGSDYRIIKSRWGTSKCSVCEQTIEPGTKIAKRSVLRDES